MVAVRAWREAGQPKRRSGRGIARENGLVEMRGLEPLTPAMRTRCSSG